MIGFDKAEIVQVIYKDNEIWNNVEKDRISRIFYFR